MQHGPRRLLGADVKLALWPERGDRVPLGRHEPDSERTDSERSVRCMLRIVFRGD